MSRRAWRHWSDGDVESCRLLAQTLSGRTRDHLLFLCDYVSLSHEQALARYAALGAPRSLDEPAVQAWLHLDRPDRAVEHVRRRGRKPSPVLERRLTRPLGVRLGEPTVLPLADHELAPYLPAVPATLDGVDVLAHLDTGGPFVILGPGRAAELGVQTFPGGRSHQGLRGADTRHGTIAELRLGAATLTNVPVAVLSTLTGAQDLVIIGTNVLQRFLTTLDQPGGRLVLSPKGSPAPVGTEVEFYLWSDHYMFARGGFGPHGLTFFVDSGLVYVADDARGPRQASLLATSRRYRSWGVPRRLARLPHFDSPEPISLGPLARQDLLVAATRSRRTPWQSFGGVRIDAMLSNGFLRSYAWTLDFDRRRYVFRQGEPR
ncbi:retropepsin-like aspartic protease [Nonomuraea typhae]|uniref:Retropepsin-like aspartic protease n=1 Tax=Nonomuraea typhae TaxID=2603600 RepID=A0ABW7Z2R0_9ACTN